MSSSLRTVTAPGCLPVNTIVDSRGAFNSAVPTVLPTLTRPVTPLSESGRTTTEAWAGGAGAEAGFFGPHPTISGTAPASVAEMASDRARVMCRLWLHSYGEAGAAHADDGGGGFEA